MITHSNLENTPVLLIQSSLNKNSKTSEIIKIIRNELVKKKIDHDYLDLRSVSLPFCDGRPFQEYLNEFRDLHVIREKLLQAKSYIIGFPIYMFSLSGVTKNFLDLFSQFMEEKYFGLVYNSGGSNGFLVSNQIINSLRLEVNAKPFSQMIYTNSKDFIKDNNGGWKLINDQIITKIDKMIDLIIVKD